MATMMPSLPTTPQRPDSLTRVLMIGSSLLGGGSVTYLVVQLIRDEPDRAFKLLGNWGPGFLLAFFIAYLVSRLMDKMLEGSARQAQDSAAAIREVAVEMRSIAEATAKQASAVQVAAEKNDSVTQEMQILIGVVNSKVEQTLNELRSHRDVFARIEEVLKVSANKESGQAT
jgi:hypothetical protein